MEVVRTLQGWAVRFEDGTRTEDMTKRAANDRMAFVAAHRAGVAAAEAERAAAVAALLERHGISEIDYRDLQPGDLFTWRPREPPDVVTDVRHFDNGASLIFRPGTSCGCILMTPSYPAYGRVNRPVVGPQYRRARLVPG